MKISETLQKSSPLIPKREMSKTEYMKLVDANTELVDKMNDLQERIDKAIELCENIKPLSLEETGSKEYLKENYVLNYDFFKTIKHLEDFEIAIWNVLEILKGEDKE